MTNTFRTRRALLQSAAAFGVWSQLGAARAAPASGKLNIGVIGIGGRGSDNLAALASENIAALCDVDQRVLQSAAERYPKATTQQDFRKLLDQNDLDAVVIATPNHTHAVIAIAAMRRGLHVYCEKPLAHTMDESRRMVNVARETKRVTQMGNQHHPSAGYRRAVQILQSGVLGDVREAHAWTSRPLWPQGILRPTGETEVPSGFDWDLWLGPATLRPYNAAYVPRMWRGWWDFGDGALGDFVPHILDPIYQGLQLGAPQSISPRSSEINDETLPEWSILRYEFPARAKLPRVTLHWYDGGRQPSPEVTGVKRLASNGVLVLGTRGRMFVPELGKPPIVLASDGGETFALPEALPAAEFTHWGEWVAACKAASPTSSDFAYGAGLSEIALLGNIALRAKQKIEWDAQARRVSNVAAANDWLQRTYRQGWQLD